MLTLLKHVATIKTSENLRKLLKIRENYLKIIRRCQKKVPKTYENL